MRQAPSSEKRDDNLKIIDFERKGNLVRFYLGSDSVEDYSGEGWETAPYSRAKTVDAKVRPGVKFCVSDIRQSQEWHWKAGRILA